MQTLWNKNIYKLKHQQINKLNRKNIRQFLEGAIILSYYGMSTEMPKKMSTHIVINGHIKAEIHQKQKM